MRTNKGKLSINTASGYYKNFAAVLKRAYQENIIEKDLASKIVFIKEEQTYRKYLSEEELVKLWNTPCKSIKLKHMAIFSALTDLRFGDIKSLLFIDVHNDEHQGDYIKLKEEKTGNLSNHPIGNNVLSIINAQPVENEFVFGEVKYSAVDRPL